MRNITVVEIRVDADPGCLLRECLRDSISLAMKDDMVVRLRHNASDYVISPNQLIESIEKKRRK